MMINEKRKIKMSDNLIVTLKRKDDGYYHNYVKMNGEVVINNRWRLERVDGYYIISLYDISIDDNGQKKSSMIKFKTGTKFHTTS